MTTYRGLGNLSAPLKQRIELSVRKVVLEVFTGVVMKSPVRTGRFRGAWVVDNNPLAPALLDRFDETGSETIRAAVRRLRAMPFNGQPTYIVNPLPYAQRLEHGWSSQAPVGMVRLTLTEIASRYGA